MTTQVRKISRAERQKLYLRNRRATLLADGKCVGCKKPRAADSSQHCEECRDKQAALVQRRFQDRNLLGLCGDCPKANVKPLHPNSSTRCEEHIIKDCLRTGGEPTAWWEELRDLFYGQGQVCYLNHEHPIALCVNAELEHVIPKNNPDYAKMTLEERRHNLMWACATCNMRKKDLTDVEFIEKLRSQPDLPGM